jgi:hypothetical protein
METLFQPNIVRGPSAGVCALAYFVVDVGNVRGKGFGARQGECGLVFVLVRCAAGNAGCLRLRNRSKGSSRRGSSKRLLDTRYRPIDDAAPDKKKRRTRQASSAAEESLLN